MAYGGLIGAIDAVTGGIVTALLTGVAGVFAVLAQRRPNRLSAADSAVDTIREVLDGVNAELKRVKDEADEFRAEVARLRRDTAVEVARAHAQAAEAQAVAGKLAARVSYLEALLRGAGVTFRPDGG